MAYRYSKDLSWRTASNKVLHGKAFNIAKNPKYDRYQRWISSMVYNFFNKKEFLVVVLKIRICQTSN